MDASGAAEVGERIGQQVGPKTLSHTHKDIARWLLQNPEKPLSLCARHFGYTQSWLSCIIHSNAFQDLMKSLNEGADMCVIVDIPARLRGVAEAALEGIADQVDIALRDGAGIMHREFLHQTAEMALKNLGYGAPKSVTPSLPFGAITFNQQNNFGNNQPQPVDGEVLARARERLLTNSAVEVLPPPQESHEVREADELPSGSECHERPVYR